MHVARFVFPQIEKVEIDSTLGLTQIDDEVEFDQKSSGRPATGDQQRTVMMMNAILSRK